MEWKTANTRRVRVDSDIEMANASHLSSSKNINPLHNTIHPRKPKLSIPQIINVKASRKNEALPLVYTFHFWQNILLSVFLAVMNLVVIIDVVMLHQITKRASKSRRVITIPATTGRWPGKWTCEYLISLKDLQLDDLAEDGRKDTEVFVSLSLQKVASSFFLTNNYINVVLQLQFRSLWQK